MENRLPRRQVADLCRTLAVSLLCGSWLAGGPLLAALELAGPFQDHGVIQRDLPIKVWGKADAGSKVSVSLGGHTGSAETADDGRWVVALPALPAGGPHELVVSSGDEKIKRTDILMGEVWLCSGQSNMEWPLWKCSNAKAEIAEADYPSIRFLMEPRVAASAPSEKVNGQWTVCTPETAGKASGVAYFFAKEQWKKHKVPIGMIVPSVGGSRIEPWISREGFLADPALAGIIEELKLKENDPKKYNQQFTEKYNAWLEKNFAGDPKKAEEAKQWAAPDFDDTLWQKIEVPESVESQGYASDGVFWLRKQLQIPPSWLGKDLKLHLGRIDDVDETFFNGQKVGETSFKTTASPWSDARDYVIPGKMVTSQDVVIAVRVSDFSGAGGMFQKDKKPLVLQVADGSSLPIPLEGRWQFRFENEIPDGTLPTPPTTVLNASTFFNGMISPFVGYGLRGFLWYQGESNAGDPEQYKKLFPALIQDWRKLWGGGDLPFFFVQLAAYEPGRIRVIDPNANSSWATLREAQASALSLPAVEMVTAIDVGDAFDIHPADKASLGERMSLAADRIVHKQDVVSSGPRFISAEKDGKEIRVRFANSEGLKVAGTEAVGFTVAGKDGKFYLAEARIDGDTIIVSSPSVADPVTIRYAWSNDPGSANLRNKQDLPAEPFRFSF